MTVVIMNNDLSKLNKIKNTCDEAEQMLDGFNQNNELGISEYMNNNEFSEEEDNRITKKERIDKINSRKTEIQVYPNDRSGQKSSFIVLSLILLTGPFILISLLQTMGSNKSKYQISYASSCGSSKSYRGQIWWPVLGRNDLALLRKIRKNYCGDAYINASGHLQLASFTSRSEAETFKKTLEGVTGERFRVGEGRYR